MAAKQIGVVSERDLFMVGLALYWAEGSKDKPWRRSGRVVFINSDPTVLSLFLAWLDLVGVPEEDRLYRLASFARATLKRHKPATVRHNVDDDYHGCLVVSVSSSGWLYYAIEGWWSALVASADGNRWWQTGAAIGPP